MLVIELAGGGELFDFMMYTGAFPEEVARTYFRQMMSALLLCHESGIYHRDIKPENLLMSDEFKLKLADFGLSAMQEGPGGDEVLTTECGTRAYMAPEVMAGLGYEGSPADVWSAGVVLFIMLCGNPPFQKADSTDWWFRKVSQGNYRAFWKAHERNPAVRFSDEAKEFVERIFVARADRRATIQELIDHPWYGGPVVDDVTLEAYMKDRKFQVDQRRAAKARQAARAAAENQHVDPFARDTMRSTETSPVPMLPADINVYSTFSTIEEPETVMFKVQTAFEELGAVKVTAESLAEGATIETLADDEGASPYTAVFKFSNVHEKLAAVGAAETLPLPPSDDADFEADDPPPAGLPSFFGDTAEDVVIEAKLYKSPEDAGYTGALRRVGGELFPFQKLYQAVLAKLGDVVIDPNAEAPVSSDDGEAELDDDPGLM
mmetsp:Transcript_42215/g.132191  ORF Transcript_42215/g.132191 Transcript_42215/m.132191 type:complete len:434 (-) Transcript_42215:272-1573(-)